MAGGPDPGLCGSCRHARIVVSGRGSRFYLCRRSRSDPRYPKYPPLPVLACPGWERPDGPDGGPAVGEGGGEDAGDRGQGETG